MKQYDAIVIGGGINSLAAAALLSRDEKSVLLIESRDKIGGMAASEEFLPGFSCNMVYDYIRWIDLRLIERLNLEKYGLKMVLFSLFGIQVINFGILYGAVIFFYKTTIGKILKNH